VPSISISGPDRSERQTVGAGSPTFGWHMAEELCQRSEDWLALFEALSVDLVVAVQRRMLGADAAEWEIEEASSKALHAWIGLANATVNALYVRTGFWDVALDSFNWLVRWQRMCQAMAKVIVAGLGPSIGLASASEAEAVQDDLQRLRREFRALSAIIQEPGSLGGLRRIK
jgi:hypothetical protein